VRVELSIDGGFAYMPGLARPIIADATQLPAEDAAQLRRLCEAALAAGRQGGASPALPIPDGRRYRLTIEFGAVRRELTAADPVIEPEVAALIRFVQDRGQR